MSIWTDLLFLHGHAATPAAARLLASPARPRPAAPPRAPIAIALRPRPAAACTPAPCPNKISPNDLW